MLIEFSIANYGPFKERNSLSMVATNYDKKSYEDENVVKDEKFGLRLLKSAAIYGGNATGKSKFLEALAFMKYFILSSNQNKDRLKKIPMNIFKLDEESEKKPSLFEIHFIHKEKMYHYGFEINSERVLKEWLFMRRTNRQTIIFEREGNEFTYNPTIFKVGKVVKAGNLAGETGLILSASFQFKQENNNIILEIQDWFTKLKIISGNDPSNYEIYSYSNLENNPGREKYLAFIKNADFRLEDIVVKKIKQDSILPIDDDTPAWIVEMNDLLRKKYREEVESFMLHINTIHKKHRNDGTTENISFSLVEEESEGTKKFIQLSGPILNCLENGGVLLVDELDTKLHPLLINKIIAGFNSRHENVNNAQLIFNTHNTTAFKFLRRDQIWFTKKNKLGVAVLEPLSDFKYGLRKDEDLEERYLNGRFGAIPFLGKFGVV
jgi:AAA15 family ATPase/GTPase